MKEQLQKEKRLYFLFSKLKDKKSNKIHFSLIVDTFINQNNNFLNLLDVSKELNKIGINIKPEALLLILENDIYRPYFEINKDFDIQTPFNLKRFRYKNLTSYKNYYNKLEKYVSDYLNKSDCKSTNCDMVIEILLTTIFNRNLSFLKKLIKSNDANDLEKLLVIEKNGKFSDYNYRVYNDMILTSGEELNEIIKILLYKTFDFLRLHYNPNIDKTLNNTYKNKIFYLDSSFIIRLFGFDNEIREHRALELITILKDIEGVQFLVHNKTLKETENNIKNNIDCVQKLLNRSDTTLTKIQNIDNKRSDIIDLYLNLKKKKKITGKEDFYLHFSNSLMKLKKIIGPKLVEADNEKIKFSSEKKENLFNELSHTEKSNSRVSHISNILLYIEDLRGSNMYNLYDIKYWLLTTDNTILKIDAKIRSLNEDNSKSVCILPTELLRTISNKTEISSNYVEVFKKFMVYSNVFTEQYSKEEIKTINDIVTLAETANNDEYDIDYYLNNLFEKINLNDLTNRLVKLKDEEKKNIELVQIFEETFGGVYKEKYLEIVKRKNRRRKDMSKILRYLIIFILPSFVLLYFILQIVNPTLTLTDPKTYVIEENWNKLGYILVIIEFILFPLAIFLNKRYGNELEKLIYKNNEAQQAV